MNARAAAIKPAVLRCAVYTRKSSDEGLEQSFNSLHAQREACEAYVKSQVGEGWTALPEAYDDGGISGGTMERPGLKRLLAQVAAGRVDVVVVYKVDRLTRSLGDFARIVEIFDKAGVSFVSVTQAFNTTSSMGRLTLNVLLSFAQFEREVTGERIRDKIAMSKARGMWMGSVPPLGYDRGDHVLVPSPAEAETVRMIFRRYLEIGSVHTLCADLARQGVISKRYVTEAGKVMGGVAFTRGSLFHLLKNRHYVGEVVHKDQTYPGLHPAIVDTALFEAVQARLAKNRVRRRRGQAKVAEHLLTGLVFDQDGRRFSPTFSTGRSGRIHRYYVLAEVQQGREGPPRDGAVRRVGADALEAFVLGELRRLADRPSVGAMDVPVLLKRLELRANDTHLIVDQEALFAGDHPELALEDLCARLGADERLVAELGGQTLRIALPRRMQLRGGRTWSAGQETASSQAKPDPTLVDGLRRAHVLAAYDEAAKRSPYERALRKVAFLSPDAQRAILEGRQPAGLTLQALLRAEPPLSWREHGSWLGQMAHSNSTRASAVNGDT